jgi:hypothetical protein
MYFSYFYIEAGYHEDPALPHCLDKRYAKHYAACANLQKSTDLAEKKPTRPTVWSATAQINTLTSIGQLNIFP